MKMVKLFLVFFTVLLVPAVTMAQMEKAMKVAVWETQRIGDGISLSKSTLVRGSIEEAIDNTPGFIKYDRAMFDAIVAEHKFQRSGAVKDEDMKRMGEMAGVQYVVVPECAIDEGYFIINLRMLDVETGQSKTTQEISANNIPEIKAAGEKLSSRLFERIESGLPSSSLPGVYESGGTAVHRGRDFTETAFGIKMKMVYVEGGTFVMGCTSDQGGECDSDESPNRETTVSSFYIGMIEITQGQWEMVMGTSIHQQKTRADAVSLYGIGPDYPMYYVNWEEAKEFCARLSHQTGRTYRLPTEAEWEYAARGGKKTDAAKYSGGWTLDHVAWYVDNSNRSTHMCGTKRPNALGIFDMSGNVCEWCEDWYSGQYLQYDKNSPKGASAGSSRVNRGGCWSGNGGSCRVANRSGSIPGSRSGSLGFRVVLVP